MKKRISLWLTIILCVVSLVAGVCATMIIHEVKDELRPDFSAKLDGAPPPDKPADKPVGKPADGAIDISSFIGIEKAKEIALEKAGISADGVIFDRVELDNDNGTWHYEVEFKKGYTEYDANIKADDGTIIKWEVGTDD